MPGRSASISQANGLSALGAVGELLCHSRVISEPEGLGSAVRSEPPRADTPVGGNSCFSCTLAPDFAEPIRRWLQWELQRSTQLQVGQTKHVRVREVRT